MLKADESSALDCERAGLAKYLVHVAYPGIEDLAVTPVNGPTGSTYNFKDNILSYFCVEANHST